MPVDLTKRPDPIRDPRQVRLETIATRLMDFVDVLEMWQEFQGEDAWGAAHREFAMQAGHIADHCTRIARNIHRGDSLETIEEGLTDLIKGLTAAATAIGAVPPAERPTERIQAPEKNVPGIAIWRLAMPLIIDRDWLRREIDEDTEKSLGKISSKHSSQRSRERKRLGYERFYVDVHKTDLEALRQMRLLRKGSDRDERERVIQQVVHAALAIFVANTFRPYRTADEAAAISIEVWQDRLAQLARVERGRPEMWDDEDDVYPEDDDDDDLEGMYASLGHDPKDAPPPLPKAKPKKPKGGA